jgi:hypothetical protein
MDDSAEMTKSLVVRKTSLIDDQGSTKSDKVFLFSDEHYQWIMCQWFDVD